MGLRDSGLGVTGHTHSHLPSVSSQCDLVYGEELRVLGLWFMVCGLCFMAWEMGFGAKALEFRGWGLRCTGGARGSGPDSGSAPTQPPRTGAHGVRIRTACVWGTVFRVSGPASKI